MLASLAALIASIGNVYATKITLIKEHHPFSSFRDPSGNYDGYLVGQIVAWNIHINVTSSTAPFPWISISNLTITDTLPNLGVNCGDHPNILYVTYVAGSQNSSSDVGPAAFTDFGNGTLLWNFGAGPFTAGVLAPPPFGIAKEFYTASVTFNTTVNGNVPDNCFLTNTGVACYTETASGVHSAPSISDTIWVPRPVLNIVKVNPAKVDKGSNFNYVLQLSNTGHEDATGVVVQDIMPTGVAHTPPATATSGSFISDTSTNVTWTGTLFNVTNPGNTVNITIPIMADTPLSSVFNSASFIAYPSDTTFTNQNANCTTAIIHPAISLTKNPSTSKIESGSLVTFNYTVTNTGDATLTGVSVTDDHLGTITSSQTLTAGQSMSFTKTTTLTANTTNIATATGVDQTGASVSAHATSLVQVIHPAITLTKTPSASKVANGSKMNYTYVVANTGDTSLTVSLTDSVFGTIFSGKVLAAGASNTTVISQVLTANTTNLATADGVDQTGASVNAKATGFVQVIHPAITLNKNPSASKVENGSSVAYTYTVTNTGDTPLTVELTDSVFGTIFTGKVMAPGASNVTIVNRVLIANTANVATAIGVDQTGASVNANATATVQVIHPAISLAKTANPSTPQIAPANFTYTYVVTNTGDVALTGVTVYDQTFNTRILGPVALSIGQSATGTYGPVTFPNAAVFTNYANATGIDQTGAAVEAFAQATVTTITPPHLDAEPPGFFLTNDLARQWNTLFNASYDLGKPLSTMWDELHPSYGTSYNITDWYDANHDGFLDPGDFIGAQVETSQGSVPYWWHVDDVTVTLKVALWPSKNVMFYLELKDGWSKYAQTRVMPNGTEWYEVYPLFGPQYRIVQWKDNCDSRLDYCDNVTLLNEDTGELGYYHVELAKTDLIVSPRTTQVFIGPTKTLVGKGCPQTIPVTIDNFNPGTTNFTVYAYYNGSTPIGNQTLMLPPVSSGDVCFNWTDNTWMKNSTYNYQITINVYANGTLFYKTIFPITFKIVTVGDMNGDGKVDMKDLGIIGAAFGTSLHDPRYNPNADINGDWVVNLKDAAIAAKNFLKADT